MGPMTDTADYTEQFMYECEQRERELALRDEFDILDGAAALRRLRTAFRNSAPVANTIDYTEQRERELALREEFDFHDGARALRRLCTGFTHSVPVACWAANAINLCDRTHPRTVY